MKIVECPRDAMQGIEKWVPTSLKIEYINSLLEVGFDTIDFGSFVSPKAIPQMKDTAEVINNLNVVNTSSNLLAIVANLRGVHEAIQFETIKYLGYPLSISETFQRRNTNRSIKEALKDIEFIKNDTVDADKKLVVYLSMAFGNPYGDPYDQEQVLQCADYLMERGVDVISLADTVGVATPETIRSLFMRVCRQFPQAELGVHLHSTPEQAEAKIAAAFESGCKRMDGALMGYGGCPMAKDDLTGNIATEKLIGYLEEKHVHTGINHEALAHAMSIANTIFH